MPGPNEPGFQTEGFWKFHVYTLDSAPKEAEEFVCAGMEAYGLVDKEDWARLGFLKVGKQDFPAPDIQHILDQHIRLAEEQNFRAQETRYSGDMDSWGFIVLTQADWRESGVVVVYIDDDRGMYRVRQCKMPVGEMADMWSVQESDLHFDLVCKYNDDSGNDGPHNKGGPPPVGEWHFAVYCTGKVGDESLFALCKAKDTIPDPRGDPSFRDGDACLLFHRPELSVNQINEDWPLDYARFIHEEETPEIGDDGEPLLVTKRHPSLFVHVQSHNPGDYKPSTIEIVKINWDHNIERSDEELKKIGRESKVTIQRCDAESLVETLLRMADEDMVKPMEELKISAE